jgi:hypothetical protein
MIDLAVITSAVARDRVAQQFATRRVPAAAPRPAMRGAAVRVLRAIADRLEPAPRRAVRI